MKVEGTNYEFEVTCDAVECFVIGHCIDMAGNEIELDSAWCGVSLYSFMEADSAIVTTILGGN